MCPLLLVFNLYERDSSQGTMQSQASADLLTGETVAFYAEKSIMTQVPPWLGTTEQLSSLEAASPGSVSDSLTPTSARSQQQELDWMLGEHSSWLLSHTWEKRWHNIKVLLVPAPAKQLPHLPLLPAETLHRATGWQPLAEQAGRGWRQKEHRSWRALLEWALHRLQPKSRAVRPLSLSPSTDLMGFKSSLLERSLAGSWGLIWDTELGCH